MLRDFVRQFIRDLPVPDPPSLVRVLMVGPALLAGVVWLGPGLFPARLLLWVEAWTVFSVLGALGFALRGAGWSEETRARLLWTYTVVGLGLGLFGWEQVLSHWLSHRALLRLLDLAAALGALAFVAAGIRYGFEELDGQRREAPDAAKR